MMIVNGGVESNSSERLLKELKEHVRKQYAGKMRGGQRRSDSAEQRRKGGVEKRRKGGVERLKKRRGGVERLQRKRLLKKRSKNGGKRRKKER